MNEHLLHFFPFLKKGFRTLDKKEVKSIEVFKELFPNEEVDLTKLKAIFLYQQSKVNTITVNITADLTSKKAKNGKV